MEGMISPGGGRSYEDFRRQVPDSVLPILDAIRDLCLSLNGNVVEDVRMHRVVFCKSMAFRWFADVAPEDGGVVIKLQRGRREPPRVLRVTADQDMTELGHAIRQAYDGIR